MISNKYLPSLVCGFGAAVLVTIPGFRNLGCCLIVPLAAVISLFLHQKVNREESPISANESVKFGLLTGFFAAIFATFFDILITYITKKNDFVAAIPQTEVLLRNMNLGPMVDQTIQFFKQITTEITTTGFSALYSIAILFSNTLLYTIFGILGGLLGMNLVNRRVQK